MSTLTITKAGGYDGWDNVFEYECVGYMTGSGTRVVVTNDGIVLIIKIYGYMGGYGIDDEKPVEGLERMLQDCIFEEQLGKEYGNDYGKDQLKDNEKFIKRKKIDNSCLEKIEKIINENIKSLTTMGGLESEPPVEDGCYSRIFLGGNYISIEATISNLSSYHDTGNHFEKSKDSILFYAFCKNDIDKDDKVGIAKNVTKLMNVFFRIRDILVENGIDEELFEY